MTIFKEKVDEEYVTTAEAKAILGEIEANRAADDDRELRYELARAIEHVNRFGHLDADESRALVEELTDLDQIDVPTAVKITDLLPEDRTELRSVFANERYSLDGTELDDVLSIVAKYS